jgi:hypothetical protein
MPLRGIASAVMILTGIAASLGCCCPARMAPLVIKPPPVVVANPPPDMNKKTQKNFEQELKKVIARNLGPNNEAGSLAANSPLWAKLRPKVAKSQFQASEVIGAGGAGPRFTDTGAEGGVLIGLFASSADDGFNVVTFLQPIFLTPQGEKVGQAYGKASANPVQCLKAKPGYAVAGMKIRSGAALDQVQLVFAKVDGEKLNLADQHLSAPVGGDGGGPSEMISKGPLVVGIHGIRAENDGFSPAGSATSLGLLYLK